MKKNYFLGLIALTALSVTSCTNDEVVEAMPQKQAIEFGTYLGRDAQARGLVLGDGVAFKQFAVTAFYTGQIAWANYTGKPNFMYNQPVTDTGTTDTKWTYSPLKYWPTTHDDKITFFAYAPMAATDNGIGSLSANKATGTPTVSYSIAADNLETQADFVADALIDVTQGGDDGTTIDSEPRSVSFGLNHELTRLSFTAQLDRDAWENGGATQINIKSINIITDANDKFYTSGTYTFANIKDETTTSNEVTTTTYKRGSWSFTGVANEDMSLEKILAIDKSVSLGGYTEEGVLKENYKENGIFISSESPVELFKKSGTKQHYLFLLPPNGENGISTTTNDGETKIGGIKMRIAYDIVTIDSNLKVGYSYTPAEKIIEFPNGSLKQGVAYNFALTFGLNEIKLSASVAGWGNETGLSDNVDWPKDDNTTPTTPPANSGSGE